MRTWEDMDYKWEKSNHLLMMAMDLLEELTGDDARNNPYKAIESCVRAKNLRKDIENYFKEDI